MQCASPFRQCTAHCRCVHGALPVRPHRTALARNAVRTALPTESGGSARQLTALPAHCTVHCQRTAVLRKCTALFGVRSALLRFSAVRFEICALRSALRSARAHCARTAECTARASGAHCASPPPGRLASLMTSPSSLMTSRVGVDRARTDTATPTPPPSSLFARQDASGCFCRQLCRRPEGAGDHVRARLPPSARACPRRERQEQRPPSPLGSAAPRPAACQSP